jgi:hypothetical protein
MGYGMNSPTGSSKYGAGGKTPKGYNQFQNFTPQMMELFQQMFAHAGPDSFLSRLASGDQSMFEEMEAPAMRQFGEMQGSIANRFSGAGMGARRGSGHNIAQNTAASEFAQDLQSKRQQYQMDAIKQLMGISNDLLGQQPYGLIEKSKPWWQEALIGIGGTAAREAIKSGFSGKGAPTPGGG